MWTGLRISCAKPGLEGDAQALCDCYVDLLGRQRYILSGAEEFCREVSARIPIYLVTNGISQIQRSRFGDCAITPYLSGMVISEEVGHAKPHPAMLYQALEMAGCAPQEAIVMGDSVTADIAAANAAGLKAFCSPRERSRPRGTVPPMWHAPIGRRWISCWPRRNSRVLAAGAGRDSGCGFCWRRMKSPWRGRL